MPNNWTIQLSTEDLKNPRSLSPGAIAGSAQNPVHAGDTLTITLPTLSDQLAGLKPKSKKIPGDARSLFSFKGNEGLSVSGVRVKSSNPPITAATATGYLLGKAVTLGPDNLSVTLTVAPAVTDCSLNFSIRVKCLYDGVLDGVSANDHIDVDPGLILGGGTMLV